ncbi:MAG: GNAT family N-acetyltransferase [Streptosporangiaceae bacterium]
MTVFLETGRISLRRFTADDVDNLHGLNDDPAVMRYINGGQPTPRDAIRDQLIPFYLDCYRRFGGLGYWAAESRPAGEFLGWFHFRPGEGTGLELGYRLRRAAWGAGYATEGSRALIRAGFTELGIERVFARTMTANAASRRVMEKCGLRFVRGYDDDRIAGVPGAGQGCVEYAVTREEWQASPSC